MKDPMLAATNFTFMNFFNATAELELFNGTTVPGPAEAMLATAGQRAGNLLNTTYQPAVEELASIGNVLKSFMAQQLSGMRQLTSICVL